MVASEAKGDTNKKQPETLKPVEAQKETAAQSDAATLSQNALKPGDLSQPLISRFGVHLIQLQERREQRLSQREQREVARQAVRMKKTEDAYATWTQEVRGRAYVEYRDPPQ